MAPHSSTLAWKIPWTEEPGGLQSMRSLRVGHDRATSLSLFTFMHWRRKWQPTPVLLPGESPGQGSMVGFRLCSHTESDTTEATQQQQQDCSTPGFPVHHQLPELAIFLCNPCSKTHTLPFFFASPSLSVSAPIFPLFIIKNYYNLISSHTHVLFLHNAFFKKSYWSIVDLQHCGNFR